MADPTNQKAPSHQFEITAGDDLTFTIRIKEDGVGQPLDDWSLDAEIRDKTTDELYGTISKGSGIEPLVSPVGDALVTVPKTITVKLRDTKCLIGDIQTVNPAGKTRTYLKMIITGDKDYTRI